MLIPTKIVKGKGRGKKVLGYATANSVVTKILKYNDTEYKRMEGKEGAWVVDIRINRMLKSGKYKAVCGISKKADDYILETHILNFDADIYDEQVSIELIYKIREQITFKSLEESKEQLEKDIDFVNRYRSCDNCSFCVYQDYGYSNYTVEGTNISCLANIFEEFSDSYDGNYVLGIATNCIYFNEGDSWKLDVDGESERPSDEWVKTEMRDIKIKNVIE